MSGDSESYYFKPTQDDWKELFETYTLTEELVNELFTYASLEQQALEVFYE